MNFLQLDALMAKVTKTLKPCPICEAPAVMLSVDLMTCTVVCLDEKCRCKIERSGINCSFQHSIKAAQRAWNNRL